VSQLRCVIRFGRPGNTGEVVVAPAGPTKPRIGLDIARGRFSGDPGGRKRKTEGPRSGQKVSGLSSVHPLHGSGTEEAGDPQTVAIQDDQVGDHPALPASRVSTRSLGMAGASRCVPRSRLRASADPAREGNRAPCKSAFTGESLTGFIRTYLC